MLKCIVARIREVFLVCSTQEQNHNRPGNLTVKCLVALALAEIARFAREEIKFRVWCRQGREQGGTHEMTEEEKKAWHRQKNARQREDAKKNAERKARKRNGTEGPRVNGQSNRGAANRRP